MADPFVTLDGTGYLSTDDVNLLDADTAHLQQSMGEWIVRSGASAPAQSTVLTPVFGDFHGISTIGAASAGLQALDIPVTGSAETTFSIYVADDGTGSTIAMQLLFFDAGAGLVGNVSDSQVATSGFVNFPFTTTVPATAVTATMRVTSSAAAYPYEIFYDAAQVRLGSDGTFVPSLRIVGDFEGEVDILPALAIPAVAGDIMGSYSGNAALRGWRMQQAAANAGGATYNVYVGDASQLVNASSQALPTERFKFKATRTDSSGDLEILYDDVSKVVSTKVSGPGDISESALYVGARDAALNGPWAGDVFDAKLRDGIGGPIIAHFDLSSYQGPDQVVPDGHQWVGSDGRIWTSHGGVTITGAPSGGANRNSQVMMR